MSASTKAFKSSVAALAIVGVLLGGGTGAWAGPSQSSPSPVPPPDCETRVGFDLNTVEKGYLLPTAAGEKTCIPFTTTRLPRPDGYTGSDYYVDEFTNPKLIDIWKACQANADCLARTSALVKKRLPPHGEYNITDRAKLFALGRVDAQGAPVTLTSVRRPAFFAQAPYKEPIAAAEADTFTIEFTAPRDAYERLHLDMTDTIKLRGWYLRGKGVDDGKGHKVRALILMSEGGGGRLVALEDPADRLYHLDANGAAVLNPYPSASTGASGSARWRDLLYQFQKAGYDVLAYDRRGIGISGGYSDTNTLQQGRDILDVIRSLKSGEGVSIVTSKGAVLTGPAAVAAVMGKAQADKMPILLGGYSRGTMSTGWAMMRNFDKTCDYDLPGTPCGPAVGLKNIKGAMMTGDYTPGPGFSSVTEDPKDIIHSEFEGANEADNNVVFFPSSAVLASVPKWPGLFVARGLWDYCESLEGSVMAYDRTTGLRELMVVRGPHEIEVWPKVEWERSLSRMLVFARAATLGKKELPGGRSWTTMKDLVATTSDVWEDSTHPVVTK